MKAARILILGMVFAAGGAAAYFISAREEKKPPAPVAKSTISTLSFAIRSQFGANTINDGHAERRTLSAPSSSAFAATIAS
jgi:hypothetical protein